MKKYITILAASLICLVMVAEDAPPYFSTVDDLIANLKKDDSTRVIYDTNGFIVALELPPGVATNHNSQLLSQIKSLRCLSSGFFSTNGIVALAGCPNLTSLRIVCSGGNHLISALPRLTNLQSLELVQNAYETNDTVYLAKMTNLVALGIFGAMPHSPAEWLPLTNLVQLRKLVIFGSDEYLNTVDTNIFSRLKKLTNIVVTPDLDHPAVQAGIWKTPVVK